MYEKIVLSNQDDIMIRFLQMRKIAISYWGFFSIFFGNLLILPLLQKTRIKRPIIQLFVSCYLSYEFYRFNLKYIVKIFNNHEYQIFKEFCLKYQLHDDLLL